MSRFVSVAVAVACLAALPVLAAGTRAFAAPQDGDPGKAAKPPESASKDADSALASLLERLADPKVALTRLDAAIAAKGFQDPKVLPALVKLLKDENRDVRIAAATALGTREAEDQKKKASEALAARIKWLDKAEAETELLVVVKSLRILAQPNAIEALLDGIHDDSDLDVVEARVMAVANIPSPEAIERLIDFMSRRHRDGSGVPGRFAKALQAATGERGANDPDVWRKWWKEHKATFDFAAAADRRRAADEAAAEKEARREGRGSKGDGKGKGKGGEKGEKGEKGDEKGDDKGGDEKK